MSYDARVFNVMIASPGDVASERNIAREAIHEWNAVHSRARQIVLLPVGWESHSSPETGNKPQKIINRQALDKCDLLVGVFWTRIGTSTDEYVSGTVEEIEKHVNAGKPAMLYFSDQPAHLDSVDPEQYAKLKEFKASCRSRGLYESYDSYSDFKEKFYRQLQIKLNEHEMFKSGNEGNGSSIIYQSETAMPQLSDEARVLLKEASMDEQGIIMFLRYIGGTELRTNGKNLITDGSPRQIAKWEAVLNELIGTDLVTDRSHKGEVFEVTDSGYRIADMIEL